MFSSYAKLMTICICTQTGDLTGMMMMMMIIIIIIIIIITIHGVREQEDTAETGRRTTQ